MTCNPWRWLWGLIPIAMLSFIAVHFEHARIEQDLSSRTAAALSRAGLKWAVPAFAGRDGVVGGTASTETDPARALAIVRDVWGVRVSDNRVELLDFVERFTWQAEFRDSRLKITGVVPGEEARAAVFNAAKSAFPGAALDDTARLARGPVDAKSWSAAARFALTQLSALRKGKVALELLGLSIEGEAQTIASFDSVTKALGGQLPGGISLVRQNITPPVVSPYVWSAKFNGGRLALEGYVPTLSARQAINATVKRRFGNTQAADRQQFAGGAPDGFSEATAAALDQLAALKSGSAALDARTLTVTGEAADEPTAQSIKAKLRSSVPRSIKLIDRITYPEPRVEEPPTPPVPSPYVIGTTYRNGSVRVTGYVPGDMAKSALFDTVRARFAGKQIVDDLQIAPGAPDGWQKCIVAGLSGLSQLDAGDVQIEDRRLVLTGSTASRQVLNSVENALRSSAGGSCDVSAKITYTGQPEPPPPVAKPLNLTPPDPAAERRKAEAERCQTLLRQAAAGGVIRFEYASADLDPKSTDTLNELARIANTCPSFRIEIEGHTDSDGTPERHQKLSDRRATSVVNFLVKAGVSAGRLTAVGYGATRPVADNATPEGRALNRRIEFSVKAN